MSLIRSSPSLPSQLFLFWKMKVDEGGRDAKSGMSEEGDDEEQATSIGGS